MPLHTAGSTAVNAKYEKPESVDTNIAPFPSSRCAEAAYTSLPDQSQASATNSTGFSRPKIPNTVVASQLSPPSREYLMEG